MKKVKKRILLVILVLLGGFLCFDNFAYAKYIANFVWDYFLKAKGFYFTSDYLDPTTVKNVDNLWDGQSIHFNLKNSLNQTVITNYDIEYTVTCSLNDEVTDYAECDINEEGSNVYQGILESVQYCVNNTEDQVDVTEFTEDECKDGEYDWIVEPKEEDLFFDIVLTNPEYKLSDVIATINVTSTAPYNKSLKGSFILHKKDLVENIISLDFNNYTNYDRLIISNSYSVDKCVKVTWDSNKLLINADTSAFSSYETDSNGYINGIKFNIGPKKNLNYIFYRKNFDIIYDVTEFLIEEDSGC
ncbi:MAG: hypothetical protein WDA21_03395 [Bacilli bacterium]